MPVVISNSDTRQKGEATFGLWMTFLAGKASNVRARTADESSLDGQCSGGLPSQSKTSSRLFNVNSLCLSATIASPHPC